MPPGTLGIKADSTSVHGLDRASVLFGRGFFTATRASSRVSSLATERRPGEERVRKVVQGVRQGPKAGHLPDRKKRKCWKKSDHL